MQVIRAASVWAAFAIVVTAGACNAVSASDSGGGVFGSPNATPTDETGAGGTTMPISTVIPCLVDEPMPGAACGGIVGVCEYGDNPDPACNDAVTCDTDGTALIAKPTACPTSCPASFDERAPGTPCNATDVCTYLEATCGCAGAIAPVGADGGADGGGGDPDAGGTPGVWQCVRPGGGCPARRPMPGTHCKGGLTCDYGSCSFNAQLTYQCMQNTWVTLSGAGCP